MTFRIHLPGLAILASFALSSPSMGQEATAAPLIPSQGDSTAQPDTTASKTPATQADINGVIGQILNVDNFYSRALEFNAPVVNRPLTIAGNASVRYSYFQDSVALHHGFTVPNVSLTFSGKLFKDYEEARHVTYAFGLASANGASPTLTDGYISYAALSTVDLANPSLQITIGQQKKVFGQEPQSTPETSPSIVGSTYLSAKNGFSDLNARDIGIVVKGDLLPEVDYGYNYRSPLISYAFSVFNGAGANATGDNNDDKEFTGRVVLAPPVDYYNILRGLTVGISGDYSRQVSIASWTDTSYTSKTVPAPTTANPNATATFVNLKTKASADTVLGDRLRWGADISYIRTPVNFTAEAVYGRVDTVTSAGSTTASHKEAWGVRKSYGGAVTVFLNLGEQFLKGYVQQSRADDWWPITWQPFFRAEYFDPDDKGVDDEQVVITPGFNVFFARTTKFQVNYRWKKTLGHPAANHETLAQFAYGF